MIMNPFFYEANRNRLIEARCNIFIEVDENTPPDFLKQITTALNIIQSKEVGKRLIQKITDSFHEIIIKYSPYNTCSVNCSLGDSLITNSKPKSELAGCSTGIFIRDYYDNARNPFFITLAHELIHAYHNSRGKNRREYKDLYTGWTNLEEYKTIVGLPSKKVGMIRLKPKISENAIRIEHGLTLRQAHHSIKIPENERKPLTLVNGSIFFRKSSKNQ